MSFDGSRGIDMWDATLEFAAQQHNIRFTYFVSGVYFLADSHRFMYFEPSQGLGRSAIGFGGTPTEISDRLQRVIQAFNNNHEIASHGNGHFEGSKYTTAQWDFEHTQFKRFLKKAWRYSETEKPFWWDDFVDYEIVGYRAPLLAAGEPLNSSLKRLGYVYNASGNDKPSRWPDANTALKQYPLAYVERSNGGGTVLSMDYNFYVAHSNARPGNSEDLDRFEQDMLETYKAYFNDNYNGNRAPIDIGHHFSLWNEGIYWNALKRFAVWACNQPDVICGTYSELTYYLNQQQKEGMVSELHAAQF